MTTRRANRLLFALCLAVIALAIAPSRSGASCSMHSGSAGRDCCVRKAACACLPATGAATRAAGRQNRVAAPCPCHLHQAPMDSDTRRAPSQPTGWHTGVNPTTSGTHLRRFLEGPAPFHAIAIPRGGSLPTGPSRAPPA
ncbi:MAG TPA: hypothetical protein VKT77_05510 [Chthonomonadaceae bacterium]|nr:hypothetical protein [Chthonomonadaceae bacterium]